MDAHQQRAVLTLCLMAAMADGHNDDRERAELRRIAESIGGQGSIDAGTVYEEVLFKKPDLANVAAAFTTPEEKQAAYEMAVGVCSADGVTSPEERAFLASVAQAFGMAAAPAAEFARTADAVAAQPVAGNALEGALVATVPGSDAEVDQMILNYSILNGALELLPQSLASIAIIPLQMRMVYRIGQAHGFQLDREHIKELLATLGVGLTSQYVEQFGRRLIGGLLGSIGGGLLGGAGSLTTGAAFSFATTYALGQVAKRYYAGGRSIDAAGLQQAFSAMLGSAKQLQGKYTSQIAEQARSIDMSKLVAAIKS